MSYKNLVKETTTTTGTGPFVRGGAVAGFRAFTPAYAVGDEVPYCARMGSQFEFGKGKVTATTIERTTVTDSSNGGALVDFSAGTKDVYVTPNAEFLNSLGSIATNAGVDVTDVGFDIVLCLGQSNMAGRGTYDALNDPADGRVWQFGCTSGDSHYRQIISGADPLHMKEKVETGLVGPATAFARGYAAMRPTNRRVLLVPLADGGTAMVSGANPPWAPGNPGGSLYENAITQANQALIAAQAIYPNSRVVGMLFSQGESDGDGAVTKAAYMTVLKALIAGLRSRVTGASAAWFIIGGMVPAAISSRAGYSTINDAHTQTASETSKCAFVAGPSGYTSDNLHYTAPGARILGARMALAVQSALNYVGVPSEPEPADTAAPTLSSPTGTATGTTTASGSVTTDEGNGTLYYWATTNTTETVAAIKASGGAQAVASTGSKAVTVTGLAANTLYYLHFAQTDAAGNNSARVTSASFTTAASADTTAPILSSPTATKTGGSTATGSVVTNEANGTLYRYASTNAVESATTVKAANLTNAVTVSGTQNVSFAGLAASTVYYPHFVHRDASGNDSAVVSGTSFTTDALPAETSYTFENDTVGAAPAGMTVTAGAMEVTNTGMTGWAGKYARFTGGSTGGPVYRAGLDSIPASANRTVTWKRGASSLAKARDGIVLRSVAGTAANGITGAQHGYMFQTSGYTGELRIYKFSNSAAVTLGSAYPLPDVANRMFRASAIGTTLKFEFSDDNGTNWTTAVTVTDGTFASGGVDYISGFSGPVPSAAYVDDISWS